MNLKDIYYEAVKFIPECTCIHRSYCAIILHDDNSLSFGFSHAPKTFSNCKKINKCSRSEFKFQYSEVAEFFEVCQVIHAEMDVLIKRKSTKVTKNTKFYLLGIDNTTNSIYVDASPCEICRKMIIEAGFFRIFVFQSASEVKEITLI